MTPAALVATVFGIGRLKPAPGTWGSLAAAAAAFALAQSGYGHWLLPLIVLVTLAGCWAAQRYADETGVADAGDVVIDEVAGQWIALLPAVLLAPGAPLAYLVGFGLFRLLDIWKPGPIGWADRRVKGGFGVMLDDLLAGAGAAVGLWALVLTLR